MKQKKFKKMQQMKIKKDIADESGKHVKIKYKDDKDVDYEDDTKQYEDKAEFEEHVGEDYEDVAKNVKTQQQSMKQTMQQYLKIEQNFKTEQEYEKYVVEA